MAPAKLVKAVEALSALAHESRLSIFRLLVRAGREGVAAGEIARKLDVLPNTLSAEFDHPGECRVDFLAPGRALRYLQRRLRTDERLVGVPHGGLL